MDGSMDYSWISGRTGVSNREKVGLLRSSNPDLMASEISRILNITRERVRQLLIDLDLETDVKMGRGFTHGSPLGIYACSSCGKDYKPKYRHQKYCSRDCHKKSTPWWIGSCQNCGKEVRLRESSRQTAIKRGHSNSFCGKRCYSIWRIGKSKSEMRTYKSLLRNSL